MNHVGRGLVSRIAARVAGGKAGDDLLVFKMLGGRLVAGVSQDEA